MKRTILCWLCSAVPLFAGTSWPNVDYKEVRAYAWSEPMQWAIPLENVTEISCRMVSTATLLAGIPSPVIPAKGTDVFGWVIAFLTPPSEQLIREDMTLVDGVINKDGAVLNAQQIKRLLKAESRRHRPRGVAACYEPHNAFVFYNAERKPVAFLEICFDCLGSRTVPEDEHCDPDFYALAVLCAELKLPFGRHRNPKQVQDDFDFAVNPAKSSPKSKRKPKPIPGIPGQDAGGR